MASNAPGGTLTQRVALRIVRAADGRLDAEQAPNLRPGARRIPPKLIFVLGSQRSGTNALRRCISLDPWVMGFNERESNQWYDDWRLRPEAEIRQGLLSLPARKVLFKPIVNLQSEPVQEFLRPWADYEAQVAWIYRDPVDVFQSRVRHWDDKDDLDDFVGEWHRVNEPVIDAVDDDGRISIVRYGDLTEDNAVFWSLCRRLGVHGENIFRPSSAKGRRRLDDRKIDELVERTAGLLARLDRRRTFVPVEAGGQSPDEADGTDQ